jgi:uncharacterized membrane protein YvbJ
MFCSQCGAAVADGAHYCAACGSAVTAGSSSVRTVVASTIEETPARQGHALPVGESANATSDLRDSRLIIGTLVVIALIVLIVLAIAHYG